MASQSVLFSYLHKTNKVSKNNPKHHIRKPPVNSVSVIELLAFVTIFYALHAWQQPFAKEVLLGGLIFFIPSTLFGWLAYRFTGAKHAQQVTYSFYLAEIVKFSATLGLFAFVFIRFNTVDVWIVMATYGLSWFLHQILLFTIAFRR
ncbi:MAG: ATP synthase subunit I [Cellvibrionales bacterium]|nr:ATP synthase subunit I [Cellvibrionales bacterium]